MNKANLIKIILKFPSILEKHGYKHCATVSSSFTYSTKILWISVSIYCLTKL